MAEKKRDISTAEGQSAILQEIFEGVMAGTISTQQATAVNRVLTNERIIKTENPLKVLGTIARLVKVFPASDVLRSHMETLMAKVASDTLGQSQIEKK